MSRNVTLKLKPFYTAREIGDAIGMSPRSVTRWLRGNGVRVTPRYPRQGCKLRVTYNALVAAFPDVLLPPSLFSPTRER